jgi:hypothetical protein
MRLQLENELDVESSEELLDDFRHGTCIVGRAGDTHHDPRYGGWIFGKHPYVDLLPSGVAIGEPLVGEVIVTQDAVHAWRGLVLATSDLVAGNQVELVLNAPTVVHRPHRRLPRTTKTTNQIAVARQGEGASSGTGEL